MTQLLIIGGSDAGISAALRAKELDPTVKISMVVADAFTYRGLNVSVVEFASSVLTTLDPDFSQEISAELKRNDVQVFNGVSVAKWRPI